MQTQAKEDDGESVNKDIVHFPNEELREQQVVIICKRLQTNLKMLRSVSMVTAKKLTFGSPLLLLQFIKSSGMTGAP